MMFKILVLMLGVMAVASSTVSRIVNLYNALETRSIEIDAWRSRTNENGSVAWNTSYLLDSYVEMYETTHDRRYLDRFASIADALINNTDAARGIQDYTGKARIGWGSTSYSPDHSRVVFLAHTSMVADPLARFAYVVNQSHSLSDLSKRAKNYQSVAETALHEFDEHWRYNQDAAAGFYIFPIGHPLGLSKKNEVEVPFNMELAAGRLLINLWKVTGTDSYKQKAVSLAMNFKKYLKTDDSGAYTWGYSTASYSNPNKTPEPEDVSHGAEDIRFVVLAAQNGIVFTRDDLDRFSKAYFRYRNNVTKAAERDALDRWVFLSWESCSVYQATYPDLISRTGRQDAEVLLALAGLARYADRCGT
jgi:hypothetical protein